MTRIMHELEREFRGRIADRIAELCAAEQEQRVALVNMTKEVGRMSSERLAELQTYLGHSDGQRLHEWLVGFPFLDGTKAMIAETLAQTRGEAEEAGEIAPEVRL